VILFAVNLLHIVASARVKLIKVIAAAVKKSINGIKNRAAAHVISFQISEPSFSAGQLIYIV